MRRRGESRAEFRARRKANHAAEMRAWDGITLKQAQYREYLQTQHWQWLRADILDKRGAKCEHCGSAAKIQLHHLTYERLGKELPTDVIILCKDCHGKAHNRRRACA